VKNLTDVVPGLQSGGAARADQNAWLKILGVDVEAIQTAARTPARGSAPQPAQSGYPSAYTTYGAQSPESAPTIGSGARSTPPNIAPTARSAAPSIASTASRSAQPGQPGYSMTTYGEQSAQSAKAPYDYPAGTDANPYVVATETPTAKEGSSPQYTLYKEEPEAADPAQQAFPGASHYTVAQSDWSAGSSLDTSHTDEDDSEDADSPDDEADSSQIGRAGNLGFEPPGTPVETGMKTKRVDDKYEGEHNKAGWRGEAWSSARNPNRVNPEDTRITTKLHTEAEQARNRLVQQPDGSFEKGDGTSTESQSMGFAMDETGRMVAFKEGGDEKISPDGTRAATDTPLPDLERGRAARIEMQHHSTALGGEAVLDKDGKPMLDAEGRGMMRSKPAALAGIVEFNDEGKIKKITNQSGHYKPAVDYLLQGVEYLMKQGAFFEDEVVRMTDDVGEGEKYKPLRENDPDFKLYMMVQAKLAEGKNIAERVRATTDLIDMAKDDRQRAAFDAELQKLKGELDTLKALVDKSREHLRKKGIGPSNRMRPDARAEFLDVKPGMTGADVRLAQTTTMHVETFVRTGGGNELAADRKKGVLQELDQKTRKKAALEELKQNPPKLRPKGGK